MSEERTTVTFIVILLSLPALGISEKKSVDKKGMGSNFEKKGLEIIEGVKNTYVYSL